MLWCIGKSSHLRNSVIKEIFEMLRLRGQFSSEGQKTNCHHQKWQQLYFKPGEMREGYQIRVATTAVNLLILFIYCLHSCNE